MSPGSQTHHEIVATSAKPLNAPPGRRTQERLELLLDLGCALLPVGVAQSVPGGGEADLVRVGSGRSAAPASRGAGLRCESHIVHLPGVPSRLAAAFVDFAAERLRARFSPR